MAVHIKNVQNLIINYSWGARGDFLLFNLLQLELNLTKTYRSKPPEVCHQIRALEKRVIPRNLDSSVEELEQYFAGVNAISKLNVPQTCHLIGCLTSEQVANLNSKFQIKQIVITDPRNFYETALMVFVRVSLDLVKTYEELVVLLQNNPVERRVKNIEKYHQAIKDKPLNFLSYEKLFQPPFTDFSKLFYELHGVIPDLDRYKQQLINSKIPKNINIVGADLEIDFDNFSIKIV